MAPTIPVAALDALDERHAQPRREVALRREVARRAQRGGAERVERSADYPHVSSDWPHSWRTILNACSGVPAAERQLILAGNAQRFYGFGES